MCVDFEFVGKLRGGVKWTFVCGSGIGGRLKDWSTHGLHPHSSMCISFARITASFLVSSPFRPTFDRFARGFVFGRVLVCDEEIAWDRRLLHFTHNNE